MFVIRSEKMTLIVQNKKCNFNVGLKLQVRSLFCSLFQAHSVFRYVVMDANTGRCSLMQNEIIASKTELPVKTLNIRILTYSVLLHYIIEVHFIRYIEKGDSPFTLLRKIF